MRAHGSGALAEVDGRNFMMLLDMCHYLVDTITQQHNFPNVQAASQLRVTRTDLTAMLSAQMYSYWDSAPAGPGVYELLRSWVKQQQEAEGGTRKKRAAAASSAGGGMARVLHLLVENELRHWPHQRVTGTFFFAKETASGAAVLVDQRTQKVYEVLGISTSIGDIMRSGGRFTKDDVLGATIKLTLLPYMAKIVYDGTLRRAAGWRRRGGGGARGGGGGGGGGHGAARAAGARRVARRQAGRHLRPLRAARAQRHDGHRDGVGRGEGAVRRPPRRRRDGGAQDGQPGGVVAAGGLGFGAAAGGVGAQRVRAAGAGAAPSSQAAEGRRGLLDLSADGVHRGRESAARRRHPSLAATARWSAWCLRAPRSRPPPTRS